MLLYFAKLAFVILLNVLASILLFRAERKTKLGTLSYPLRQTLIGLIFGSLAIFSTEYGIEIDGAIINVRDSAPLCAGLIFGAPAGLIAGLIGGIERWFAVLWGAGEYTRLACTIGTIIAGIIAATLRKFLFDNKIPSWFYGLSIGLFIEVLHMLLIFMTNTHDVQQAFSFVTQCAGPMISANCIAVALAIFAVTSLGRERKKEKTQAEIAQTFQRWLLFCVVIGFIATCLFVAFLQTQLSYGDTDALLRVNLNDVRERIQAASDKNLLQMTRRVSTDLYYSESVDRQKLLDLAERYGVHEIDIIDENGIIVGSTEEQFIGFNMASGEQSAEFLPLLGDVKEIVQPYQPISYDSSTSRKYAGVQLAKGGFLQLGYNAEQFQEDIDTQVVGIAENWHIGETGGIIVANTNSIIVSDNNGQVGKELSAAGISIDPETLPEKKRFNATLHDEESFCMYAVTEGYYIIATIPESEAMMTRNISIYITAFMEILLFTVFFILIYYLVKKVVVDNIHEINTSLGRISRGNLNVTVDVRSNREFSSLSDDINTTVDTLKQYIADAASRIDEELAFAKSIQLAALPSVFPPYPDRHDFDIFATMDTAKAVGGDFYDLFLLDGKKLAVVIADVSGKGIPAALFMMTAKTLIKNHTLAGLSPAKVFETVNNALCENNTAEMFVTAFMAILDLEAGSITYVNAGHNKPLIRTDERGWRWLDCKAGFVLGGMEAIKYREYINKIKPGDQIFMYTDGVTEAVNTNEDLYSDERLITKLNQESQCKLDPKELLLFVQKDVDSFSDGAEQADDITMLSVRYNGIEH